MALKREGDKSRKTNVNSYKHLNYNDKDISVIEAVLVRTIPSSMHRIKPKMITRQDS